MKKLFLVVAMAVAAMSVVAAPAEAAKKKKAAVVVTPEPPMFPWSGPWSVRDPKLEASNTVVSGAWTGASFAMYHKESWSGGVNGLGATMVLTSIGCAAVSPIVGTLVLNRPLTMREGHVTIANCFIPFLGGWMVNAAYDAHPEWEAPAKPAKPVKVAKKR
jgi:opacity protein-like surface antigen